MQGLAKALTPGSNNAKSAAAEVRNGEFAVGLGFRGACQVLELSDLIGMVRNQGLTRRLLFSNDSEAVHLHFRDGDLLHAHSENTPKGLRLGEITRDPRLDSMLLDGLFMLTRLVFLGPDGKPVNTPRVSVITQDGRTLLGSVARSSPCELTLPRGQRLNIWADDTGCMPAHAVVLDARDVTLQLERVISAYLQVSEPRDWSGPLGDFALSLRHAERDPDALGKVHFSTMFWAGFEHSVSFPGPGRYDLWVSARSGSHGSRHEEQGPPGAGTVRMPLRSARKLDSFLIVTDSDEGAHLRLELPLDPPSLSR
ncbi:MAG: hypothetical protein ACI8QC_003441 [Planctomycetota bacterium]